MTTTGSVSFNSVSSDTCESLASTPPTLTTPGSPALSNQLAAPALTQFKVVPPPTLFPESPVALNAALSPTSLRKKDMVQHRKQREFTPDERKDNHYWDRRRRNNEAAKRSREKRRINDVVMEGRILELTNESLFLRAEIQALREKFNVPLDAAPLVLQNPNLLAAAQNAINFGPSLSSIMSSPLAAAASASPLSASSSVLTSQLLSLRACRSAYAQNIKTEAHSVLGTPSLANYNAMNRLAPNGSTPSAAAVSLNMPMNKANQHSALHTQQGATKKASSNTISVKEVLECQWKADERQAELKPSVVSSADTQLGVAQLAPDSVAPSAASSSTKRLPLKLRHKGHRALDADTNSECSRASPSSDEGIHSGSNDSGSPQWHLEKQAKRARFISDESLDNQAKLVRRRR